VLHPARGKALLIASQVAEVIPFQLNDLGTFSILSQLVLGGVGHVYQPDYKPIVKDKNPPHPLSPDLRSPFRTS